MFSPTMFNPTMFNPTPYKISTITATGSLNSLIDLESFYNEIDVVDAESDGIIYVEYGKKKSESLSKGYNKKHAIARRKNKALIKRFDNQATVIIKTGILSVNVKVFKNGNVQMTGLKTIEQGRDTVQKIVDAISNIFETKGISVVEDIHKMVACNYAIRLINSDFRIGIEIKRDKLNQLLRSEYSVSSSFEPCIYPGVKIQYYWNPKEDTRGVGLGDLEDKKITIAVFQSGCIIITGAQQLDQIDMAYEFICSIINDNIKHLQKILPITDKSKSDKSLGLQISA